MALAIATTLHSCSDDDDYSPGEQETTAQVYFSSEAASSYDLSSDETFFEVSILRAVTDDAITVPLTSSGTDGLFTVPSSVSFAQGESEASIEIIYDPDELEYDNYTEITITIDESYTTAYGISSYTFTAGIPAPWESLGYATYTEDFMTTFWSVGNLTYEVEIQENSLVSGYYRLVNPYGEAYPWNEEGDWDDSQDWYFEIHAEDPEGVYIELQETGMDWGYGNIIMGSLAYYYMASGYTLDDMKYYGYTGTMEDDIITFPTSTLLICMPDYSSSYYYANTNGAFMVALPGAVIADYSVEVSYVGQYTDSSDEPAGVIAEVTEIGEDVEYVRLAIVEGTTVDDDILQDITDGTYSYTDVTATGQALVPWTETPADGRYSIVAVAYADDEVVASASASFKYTAPSSETWTAISTGDYTYYQFFEGVDEGLTLYQSDADATRYKIEHWGYDVDFCFTYDESTGSVTVDDQEIGYESSYGMVYVMELADYVGSDSYGVSYYEDGVFYFNVIYYVSAGYFGYGYETFTLSDASAVAAKSVFEKSVKASGLMMNKKFVSPKAAVLK